MHSISTPSPSFKALAALCSLVVCLALGACGGAATAKTQPSSSSSPTTTMKQIPGISATGTPGGKPKISFHHPMSVENDTYAVLQQGKGATIQDGDRVCAQGIALNAKDGSELMSTWEKNTPDCTLTIQKGSTTSGYYSVIKGQRVGATLAFGVNDSNSSGTSYIMALTLISRQKALTRAQGEKVANVPANLPKVTLDKNGKPSLDLNGYKPDGSLVAQPLITGKGARVKETDTVDAQYTGWTLDTKGKLTQFDSSWDRGQSASFPLSSVVTGWKKGLTGQTVGSQVLLVVPPNEGYGSKAQAKIPANSTLYFVVDILYAS